MDMYLVLTILHVIPGLVLLQELLVSSTERKPSQRSTCLHHQLVINQTAHLSQTILIQSLQPGPRGRAVKLNLHQSKRTRNPGLVQWLKPSREARQGRTTPVLTFQQLRRRFQWSKQNLKMYQVNIQKISLNVTKQIHVFLYNYL